MYVDYFPDFGRNVLRNGMYTQPFNGPLSGTTLLDTVKARKLAYGHTMRKQGSCLEKEIM